MYSGKLTTKPWSRISDNHSMDCDKSRKDK